MPPLGVRPGTAGHRGGGHLPGARVAGWHPLTGWTHTAGSGGRRRGRRDGTVVSPPALSVVVPMYDEEDGAADVRGADAAGARRHSAISYEVVAVDDGSRDATPRCCSRPRRTGPSCAWSGCARTAVIRPPSPPASAAPGALVVATLDADLQDPPEVIAEMLTAAREQDVDVVYGVRSDRRGHRVQADDRAGCTTG